MVQENIGKEIPNTITVDVNTGALNKKYDTAEKKYNDYSQSSSDGYSTDVVKHTGDVAAAWLPFLMFLIFSVFILKRNKNVNNKALQSNDRLCSEVAKTNILLQQILEKLDKK